MYYELFTMIRSKEDAHISTCNSFDDAVKLARFYEKKLKVTVMIKPHYKGEY